MSISRGIMAGRPAIDSRFDAATRRLTSRERTEKTMRRRGRNGAIREVANCTVAEMQR
jgi:hypothetical protein